MTNEVKDEVHLKEMGQIGLHSQLDYFISSINMQGNKEGFSQPFISFLSRDNTEMFN